MDLAELVNSAAARGDRDEVKRIMRMILAENREDITVGIPNDHSIMRAENQHA